ncbi:hypothetical protein [Streptomyces sp. Isolate_45]|uniref:hypothetical protein n=1 Tax=Streptomyces sp. Isolate_45 TaxID=2950111 RepID=UPI002481C5F8|nr:hypothetical protein [Streptomyces sp. Isolate_45]MDA5282024.1 hypothetical protein [Streptomyces sp. Isolate_45]
MQSRRTDAEHQSFHLNPHAERYSRWAAAGTRRHELVTQVPPAPLDGGRSTHRRHVQHSTGRISIARIDIPSVLDFVPGYAAQDAGEVAAGFGEEVVALERAMLLSNRDGR